MCFYLGAEQQNLQRVKGVEQKNKNKNKNKTKQNKTQHFGIQHGTYFYVGPTKTEKRKRGKEKRKIMPPLRGAAVQQAMINIKGRQGK